MERKMFYKANPLLFARAKELRNNVTPSEMVLWGYLRTKPMGYRFRRQHPVGQYIADFFCFKLQLIIEADGTVHDTDEARKYDEERDQYLGDTGIQVLRIRNIEIHKNLRAVIGIIEQSMKESINHLNAEGGLTPPLGGWGV